ncbi:MBL fold metallo-hydrolase [Nocardia sp. NPDC046473]|uniref:MBL fold metallo-hydrolase n=1 Tax=Nocardia sp. NPDC046473 TaxID=3155733 RepID=UPI0033F603E8
MNLFPLACRGRRLRRAPRMRSVQVGDMRVTYVPDGVVGLRPRGWLPETTAADWRVHARYLGSDGCLVAGIGGLLVETGGRRMLIDAGVGAVSVPADPANPLTGALRGGALLDNLARLGVRPDQLDAIAITHMHIDHIGWALHPAFARTRLRIPAPEWAWWNALTPAQFDELLDRMAPWAKGKIDLAQILGVLAPRVETVSDGAQLAPGVTAVLTPGHTAGHTGYTLTSRGRTMRVFGDVLHSPLQIRHPEWACAADLDPDRGVLQRCRLVDELAETGDLAAGIHFADVVFGTVRRDLDGATSWVPAWTRPRVTEEATSIASPSSPWPGAALPAKEPSGQQRPTARG